MALKRDDLSRLITPAGSPVGQDESDIERIKRRKLTPEEVQRGLEAMNRIEQINKEILARCGGVPFPDSVEIIHRMREERDRQLMEALGWDDLR